MTIKNNITGKQYPISRADWEKLGKNKSIFTVVDEKDVPSSQTVNNVAAKSFYDKKDTSKDAANASNTANPGNSNKNRPSTGEKKK